MPNELMRVKIVVNVSIDGGDVNDPRLNRLRTDIAGAFVKGLEELHLSGSHAFHTKVEACEGARAA